MGAVDRPGIDVLYATRLLDLAYFWPSYRSVRRNLPWVNRIVVVVPDADVAGFADLGLDAEVVGESDLHDGLPGIARGWMRQQVVKLCAHLVSADRPVLVLDADVLVAQPAPPSLVFEGSMARCFVERWDGATHRGWHGASAKFLGIDRTRPSIFPTPNVMDTDVLHELHAHLGSGDASRGLAAVIDAAAGVVDETHDPPFTEWALYGLFARHLSATATERVRFCESTHVTGVWDDTQWRERLRHGRWAERPFLVVHSWLTEDLLTVRRALAGDPALAPLFTGDGRGGWLIPAGTTMARHGFARSAVTVERTRLLQAADVEDDDGVHTVFRLRPDRWGADGGGGIMRVATAALMGL
ncbi:MAG: DUF6492 family protein [Acidimicrobiales bacterium]